MQVGIIGYGAFGKLLAEELSKHAKITVYNRSKKRRPSNPDIVFGSFDQAVAKDVVILCVSLSALDEIANEIAKHAKPDTVVVDVCSVKIQPVRILSKHLKNKCKILHTHPLFGPQTVNNSSLAGHTIAVCPYNSDDKLDKIMRFLKNKLKLKVVELTAKEHDKEMAWVHALTFFVGRGLMQLNPPKSRLATGYYHKIQDLVELESSHSIELFQTVQKGNPFATQVRRELIEKLQAIDLQLKGKG